MFLLIYISCDSYQRKHLLTYIFLLFFVCPTNSSSLLCLCIYCLPSKFAFFTVDVFIACPTNLPSLLFMYLLLAQQMQLMFFLYWWNMIFLLDIIYVYCSCCLICWKLAIRWPSLSSLVLNYTKQAEFAQKVK
jgi:hypothetical protein